MNSIYKEKKKTDSLVLSVFLWKLFILIFNVALAFENTFVINEIKTSWMGEDLGTMLSVWNIKRVSIGWLCGRMICDVYNSDLILHSLHTWNMGAWGYTECEIGWKSQSKKNILSLVYYRFLILAYLKIYLGRFI